MNSETWKVAFTKGYGSLLVAAWFSASCQHDFNCEIMGTLPCPGYGGDAGVTDETEGTQGDPTTADTLSTTRASATLGDASTVGAETGGTSSGGGDGTSASSTPHAECLPLSDDGCSGEKPWCLGGGETGDAGLPHSPRCVQCEDNTHCQWPYAPRDQGGICIGYVCTPCELETNRGCDENAPYCIATSATSTDADASVGHFTEGDGGIPVDTVQCVECLTESDCDGDTPACVNHACVACDRDEQCGNADAARCDLDTNTCAPCNAAGQCAHLSDTPACDASGGSCVECTREEQTKCGTKVCNLMSTDALYQTCSEFFKGETGQCGACVSDQQCSEGFLCVPETYRTPSADADAAAPEPTGMNYCMRRVNPPATTCNLRRPFIGQHEATSEGGVAGTYCRPRYTTCAAYSMHGNGPDVIPESEEGAGLATCFNNDSCGLPGIDDGYCVVYTREPEVPTNLCTYECSADLDCKANSTCNLITPPEDVGAGHGVCTF